MNIFITFLILIVFFSLLIFLLIKGVKLSKEGNPWGILLGFLALSFIGAVICFIYYEKNK